MYFSSNLSAWASLYAAFLGFLGGTIINHLLTLNREKRREKNDAQALAVVLASELQGMAVATREHLALFKSRIDIWSQEANEISRSPDEVEIPPQVVGLYPIMETPAYDATVGNLGILPLKLAQESTAIYQRVATWRRLEHVQPRRWLSTYIENQSRNLALAEKMECTARHLIAFSGSGLPTEAENGQTVKPTTGESVGQATSALGQKRT